MEEFDERDFVTFEDEDGNKFELDVIHYFTYMDEDYAILADFSSDEEEIDVDTQEFFILKVVSDGEIEEFVNPDEDKMDALAQLAEEIINSLCDDDCDCGCHDEHHEGECGCGCEHHHD